MNRLQRYVRFLAPKRLRWCGWATARVIRLHRCLKTENLPTILKRLDQGRPGILSHNRHAVREQAEDLWKFLNVLLIPGLHRKDVCLVRSLVLFEFLRSTGVPVGIHFGVQTGEPALTGHCWITLDNRPLLEGTNPESTFQEMFSYPPEPDRS